MTSPMKMTSRSRNTEHGIALLFSLIALLLLTAITTSLIMLSDTDSKVNANYRSEEVAFFAAKAGVYEALDRMQNSNANSIECNLPNGLPGAAQTLPWSFCPQVAPAGVLYLVNSGSGLTVQPWSATNTYMDKELCHDGFTISGWPTSSQTAPADVPCTSVPSGTTWYKTVNSNYPWSGTSVAIPYEWVRINEKQNSSVTYISGTGATAANATYSVSSVGSSTTPVCWDGASEGLLSTPIVVTTPYTTCGEYQTCSSVSPVITTPVYMITALSVTSNGSRQMVQAEAALRPPVVNPPNCVNGDSYGFFAYGAGFSCSLPALTIGGNAKVDGYNSANGPYSATNKSATLGSVGTNQGAVEAGSSTNVGGTIYVRNDTASAGPPAVAGPGTCPDDFSISGNPTYGGLASFNTDVPKPTISTPPDTSTTDKTTGTVVPGTYRNLTVGSHGSVVLTAPGTYTFDCITLGSFGTVTTSPASKAVTIYLTGTGCATTPGPLTMNSHSQLVNTSGISANLQINYAGTGTISVEGGPSECAVINAPNAPVTLHGGNDFFGTIMANSIDDSGGVSLHFDTADAVLNTVNPTTVTAYPSGSYTQLSYRSVPY